MNNLELLEVVITHLSEFADVHYVKQLRKLVNDSEYNNLTPVLDKILKYHEANGIFPSKKYFLKAWKLKGIEDKEFLIEYASEIVAKLRTQIVYEQVKDIVDTGEPSGDLITQIQKCLYKYTPEKVNKNFDEENLADSLRGILQKKKQRGAGLLTYTSIDKYTHGCPFGATTVIGAKPKSGKSNVSMSIAYGAITKQNLKGVYISLELSADVIYQRLYSRYLYDKGIQIDNAEMIKAAFSKEEHEEIYDKYLDEFQDFIKDKITVVTQENLPELTKVELETFLLRKDMEMGGLDFVIVDQVSLLKYFTGITTTSGKDKTFDIINAYIRYFTVASYTLFKKPVAMILLCQIKRDYYNTISARKPIDLDCFAEASEIERSTNIAVVLRLDDQLKNSNLIELVLVVNRDGDSCVEYVPNIFIPKHTYLSSFGETEYHSVEQDTSSLFKFTEDMEEDLDDLFG
jgi:effector-binding domain-containing protein